MRLKQIILKALFSFLFVSPVMGQELVPFLPGQGVNLFMGSQYRCDYWALSRYFDTQINDTYCGVASGVMILNALEIEKPMNERFGNHSLFTQEAFFTDAVKEIVLEENVKKRGMTLEELTLSLLTYDVSAQPYYAQTTSIDNFRDILKTTLNTDQQFLIANFHRPTIGQKGGGHFSPIAAYNEEEDRVLILDVSRYKYPPFWVSVDDLWQSMLNKDTAAHLSRGFLVISSLT